MPRLIANISPAWFNLAAFNASRIWSQRRSIVANPAARSGAANAPAKTEPAKIEPAKTEPARRSFINPHPVELQSAYTSGWLRTAAGFARLSRGFWAGPQRKTAWVLTGSLASLILANLFLLLQVNGWTRRFFDALEVKNQAALISEIIWFPLLVLSVAGISVLLTLARMTMTVRWRAWITEKLLALWLSEGRILRLRQTGLEPANPEYRITDDVRMALEPLVDLSIAAVAALLTAASFFEVLWLVGGDLTLSIGSAVLVIPAYFVIASFGYGALTTWLTLRVGSPLIEFSARKNEAEAKLRFEMVRAREAAEALVLSDRARDKHQDLHRSVQGVVARWLLIARQQGRLTWIVNGNGVLAPVIPLLLATPKYLSGELSLGAVTQIAAASIQVQLAINVFIENFIRVAEWHASAHRIEELTDAIAELDIADARDDPTIVPFAKPIKKS